MVGILPGSADTTLAPASSNSGKRRMKTSHQDLDAEKPIKREPSPVPGELDDMQRLAENDILKFEVEDLPELEAGDTSELETDAPEDTLMSDEIPGPLTSLPRLRKVRFSDEELNVLIQEVHDNISQLFGELSVRTPTAVKNKIWEDIVAKVNAVGVTTRTVHELKKRWHDLRRRTKMKLSVFEHCARQLAGGSSVFHHQRLLQETIHPHQIQGISDLDTSSAIFASNAATSTNQDTEEDINDIVEHDKCCVEVTETSKPQRNTAFHREPREDNQQFSDHFKASQNFQQKLITELQLLRNEMSQSTHGLQQTIDMHLTHIASSINVHMAHIASSLERHLSVIAANMVMFSQKREHNADCTSVSRDLTPSPSGIPPGPICTFSSSSSSETEAYHVINQTSPKFPKSDTPFPLERGSTQGSSKARVKRKAEFFETEGNPSKCIDNKELEPGKNGVFRQINEGQSPSSRALRSRLSGTHGETNAVKRKVAK
ncbi:hypothetical protein GDO86_017141 [Hymenochirus boettgeri]|uniref:Myb/SANT-like DNA-binding domain-containing protein n=1 Tax=Hymenochirus boettgeri TaxID=247094 RepID=A0A8T2IP28_9PIPI|nr:hypothetical protein GDO86_017141 [Hymenochirus boettgeri]